MLTTREIFDGMTLEWIEGEIAAGRSESLHMEFKTLADSQFPREDRKLLAKCMSAFLNSEGGILIYGVQCRKDAEGVDVAQAIRPVGGLRRAMSRLNSILPELVSPIHEGIIVRDISVANDAGLIALYAPASDFAPHMACAGEGRYYKRSGSNSVSMEHFDLEDMFGRRPKPRLRLQVNVFREGQAPVGDGGSSWTIHVVFSIYNEGRGVAKYPLLGIGIEPPYALDRFGLDGNRNHGLPIRKSGSGAPGPSIFAGGADAIVHESTTLEVCKACLTLREGATSATPVRFEYGLGADGIRTVEARGVISEAILLSALSGNELGLRYSLHSESPEVP